MSQESETNPDEPNGASSIGGGRRRENSAEIEGAEIPPVDWPERPDIERLRRLVQGLDVAVDVEHNAGTVIGLQITAKFERMLEQQPLHDDLLKTIRSVFQPPKVRVGSDSKEYEDLLGTLIDPGSVVVLTGRPGSGRTITGLALLAHLKAVAGVTVSTLSYGGARKFSLRRVPHNQRCGYLLELPADDAEFAVSSDFGLTLHGVRGLLRQTASHLVVITTEEQWDQVGHGAPVRPVEVSPAAARDIAAAWLRISTPDLSVDRWVGHQDIADLLERETPRGAMEIVGLIAKAAHAAKAKLPALEPAVDGNSPSIALADEEEEFYRRVSSVVAARKSWRRQLLEWHRKPGRTSFERNFLLAAATLREAPVGEVYAATATLARQLGDEVPPKGQQGPGIIQLADAIEADLSGNDDSLEFARPGWDDAVLHYFWIDRPLSRQAFLSWIAQAPLTATREIQKLSPGSSTTDRTSRAVRMASFALRWATRQRRPDYLEEIVVSWHGQTDLWPAAVDGLTRACFDPLIGRETHNLLLNWAKRPDLALLEAVSAVCAGDFGRAYPGKALVRLGHVAGSRDPRVAEIVRKAVQTLWLEQSLNSALMNEILKWCTANDEARRAAGRRAFGALAELPSEDDKALPALISPGAGIETPLADWPDVDSGLWLADLACGWRSILQSPAARTEAAAAGRLWFDACLVHPEVKSTIFYVFRRAVSEPGDDGSGLQHQILDLLYDWQPADDQAADRVGLRHALTDLLLHDGSRALLPYGPHPADERRA
ncbi:hypothetical protein ABZU53_22275 [Micromonospora sp. NPDC005194]|uniref:hypothetical protein n=1 Tax=Micromonospora sp. NPDC005194 TaxID=3156870 RepID=UPI0033BABFC8